MGRRSLPHSSEAAGNLLPEHHLVDAGYIDSTNLIQSREKHAVDLVGPTLKNHWYQAETGYDLTHFSIDWDAQVLTCPQGRRSASWTPAQNRKGNPVVKVKFSQTDCKACPSQVDCTSSTRRTLTLQPRQQMEALIAARQREGTADFKELYRHRAGIEGVHSQATRTMGLRRSRYIGLRKTHLGHVAIATAINLVQLISWLNGEAPAQTRTSRFKKVMSQAA
jgi:transposase